MRAFTDAVQVKVDFKQYGICSDLSPDLKSAILMLAIDARNTKRSVEIFVKPETSMRTKRRDLTMTTVTGLALVLLFQNCSGFGTSVGNGTLASSGSGSGGPGGGSGTPPGGGKIVSAVGEWHETATDIQYSRQLWLDWKNPLGDYVDATGVEQGPAPFSSARFVTDRIPGVERIDVTQAIKRTGKADFLLVRTTGRSFQFHSREAAALGPTLVIDGGTPIPASKDTTISRGSNSSRGSANILNVDDRLLIAFAIPASTNPTTAPLVLNSTGTEYGDSASNFALDVYVADSSIRILPQPAWLDSDSTVIASFTGADLKAKDSDRASITLNGTIATSTLLQPKLTWMSAVFALPPAADGIPYKKACATVIEKLYSDFAPGQGGKHPGFSNMGLAQPGLSEIIDGVAYPDTGWRGRQPDGIHWSARSGYDGYSSSHMSFRTYYYAEYPHNTYGWADAIGHPLPKGQWSAYIQCMQVNSVSGTGLSGVGNRDGKLYYQVVGVGGATYSREDIVFRNHDYPQSHIRECWVDYFCGGTNCGPVTNNGTVSFAKAIVTKGLPDVRAIQAEVDALNASGL